MSFLSKEDAIKVAKGMGGFALVIGVILLSSLTGSAVVMTLAGGAACAGLAKLSTKGSLKNIIGWGAIGAVAGFLFWTTL
jgi:hypothetical protein